MTAPATLMRGTLDVLILRTLTGGALHGYGVVALIEERTGGALSVEDGALYQSLHRMEARGWVVSEWGHAESGKRAKFYSITREGRRQLRTETESWFRYVDLVSAVLRPDAT